MPLTFGTGDGDVDCHILARAWILLVVLMVIGCEGVIVSEVRGISGSDKSSSYADGHVTYTKPFNPKHVIYQVFGPAGNVAAISYFNVNLPPQQVDAARLAWSLKITTTSLAVVADIVEHGDSDSFGCRIVVDSEVNAERISNEVNADTHCLVQGA